MHTLKNASHTWTHVGACHCVCCSYSQTTRLYTGTGFRLIIGPVTALHSLNPSHPVQDASGHWVHPVLGAALPVQPSLAPPGHAPGNISRVGASKLMHWAYCPPATCASCVASPSAALVWAGQGCWAPASVPPWQQSHEPLAVWGSVWLAGWLGASSPQPECARLHSLLHGLHPPVRPASVPSRPAAAAASGCAGLEGRCPDG